MPDDVLPFQDRFTVWVGAAVPDPVSPSVVLDGWPLLATVKLAFAVPDVSGLKVMENDVLWPAGIVTGKLNPPMVNTELFVLAPVTVTFAPLALNLPDALLLVPTTTLPRLSVPGLTASCPTAVVPVPDSEMLTLGLVASDVMLTLPEALPAACGANATVKTALCEAFSVRGVLRPLKWNPVPLTDAFETVTVVPPVFVSVTLCDCVLPTVTLPKASLPGFTASCPSLIPVPDKAISVMAVEASLPIAALALKLPAALGVNARVSDALCPAAIVTGRLGAVNEKYFVDTEALLMLADVLPVLLTESVSVLLLPASTLPKSKACAPNDKLPVAVGVGVGLGELDDLELNPWHPTSTRLAASTIKPAAFFRHPGMVSVSQPMTFIPILSTVLRFFG
jgi:hypothetical protein